LEHTHLVKGLDYALLQKVRAELDENDLNEEQTEKIKNDNENNNKNNSDDDDDKESDDNNEDERSIDSQDSDENEDEKLEKNQLNFKVKSNNNNNRNQPKKFNKQSKIIKQEEINDESATNQIQFKTKLARNIFRVLFDDPTDVDKQKSELKSSIDLFQPRRMTYIVDLNEEDTDIPITSIRSKADCPMNESNVIMTTNDIVINKLTQILSYLRHGKRDSNNKKIKKKNFKPEDKLQDTIDNSIGIYDDIGEYQPNLSKKEPLKKDKKDSSHRKYFEKDNKEEDIEHAGPSKEVASEFIRNINQKYSSKDIKDEEEMKNKKEKKDNSSSNGMSVKFAADSYAECYPGTIAEEDVNVDSDEEADFAKMDLGNKKGPVNRWDFDTNEEYTEYMSNREAMPKAAFQFGVKMEDGRKSRRLPAEQDNKKNEKVKLDKEWGKISKIIDKRKSGGGGGDSEYKKIKY
jgi:IK cytokine